MRKLSTLLFALFVSGALWAQDCDVAPFGLTSQIDSSCGLLYSWTDPDSAIDCQLRVVVTIDSVSFARKVRLNTTDQICIRPSALTPGAMYATQIRCACSLPPDTLILTPWSDIDTFIMPSIRIWEDQPMAAGIEIELYPNPAADQLNIRLAESSDIVRVVDLSGRTHLEFTGVAEGTTTLDISSLNAGLYLVQVVTASGTQTEKIRISE